MSFLNQTDTTIIQQIKSACTEIGGRLEIFDSLKQNLVNLVDPSSALARAQTTIDIPSLEDSVKQIEEAINKLYDLVMKCTVNDLKEDTVMTEIKNKDSLSLPGRDSKAGIISIFKVLLNGGFKTVSTTTEDGKRVLRRMRTIVLKYYSMIGKWEDALKETSSTLLMNEIVDQSRSATANLGSGNQQLFRRMKKYAWSDWYPLSGNNVYFVLKRTEGDITENDQVQKMAESRGGGIHMGQKLNDNEIVINLKHLFENEDILKGGGVFSKSYDKLEYTGYPIQLEQILDTVDKYMSYIPRKGSESQKIHLYIKHNLPRYTTASIRSMVPIVGTYWHNKFTSKSSTQIPNKIWLCVCIRYMDEGERVLYRGEQYTNFKNISKHPEEFTDLYDHWETASQGKKISSKEISSKVEHQKMEKKFKELKLKSEGYITDEGKNLNLKDLESSTLNCTFDSEDGTTDGQISTQQMVKKTRRITRTTYDSVGKTITRPIYGSKATHYCYADHSGSGRITRFGKYKMFVPLVMDSSKRRSKLFKKQKMSTGGAKKFYHWSESPEVMSNNIGIDDYDYETGDVSGIIVSYDPCAEVRTGIIRSNSEAARCKHSRGKSKFSSEYLARWKFPSSLAVIWRTEKVHGTINPYPDLPTDKKKWVEITKYNNIFHQDITDFFSKPKTRFKNRVRKDKFFQRCYDWSTRQSDNLKANQLPAGALQGIKGCDESEGSTDCEEKMYRQRIYKCYGLKCINRLGKQSGFLSKKERGEHSKHSASYAQCKAIVKNAIASRQTLIRSYGITRKDARVVGGSINKKTRKNNSKKTIKGNKKRTRKN